MTGTMPHGWNPETRRAWTLEELWPDLTPRERLERVVETRLQGLAETTGHLLMARQSGDEFWVEACEKDARILQSELDEARRLLLTPP